MAHHKGSAFVEIFQNCIIFNDDAFQSVTDRQSRPDNSVLLEHGKPLIFGKDRTRGIRLNGLDLEVVTLGENGVKESDLLVHDETREDSSYAFLLSRLEAPRGPTPLGVFRRIIKPTYEDMVQAQVKKAREKGVPDFKKLLYGSETWTVT